MRRPPRSDRSGGVLLAPAAVVLAAACTAWLAWDVTAWEVLRFLGYQAAFVLLPGLVAQRLLLGPGRDGALRRVAIGWPLGYLLAICAYAASSAAGVDAIFYAYPAVAAVVVVTVWRRSHPAPAPPGERAPRAWVWAIAALCVVAIGYEAASFYPQAPIPRAGAQVGNYNPDILYDLALAGEALHHFPLEEPATAGVRLSYHSFPYFEMAAAAKATGIDLPVVLFRLDAVPMLVLLVLQLAWAGTAVTGRRWGGAIAAAVVLLFGELDLDGREIVWFGNWLASVIWGPYNHGFLLGLLFFVPLVVVLGGLVAEGAGSRTRATWALVVALLVGCGGAKGISLLPLIGGALVLWLVWILITERRIAWTVVAAGAATAAVLALAIVVQYVSKNRGEAFDPLASPLPFKEAEIATGILPDVAPVRVLLLAVGALGAIPAVIAGCALAVRAEGLRRPGQHAWFVALLVAGFLPLFFFHHPGASNMWPMLYAGVAGALLAAEGLARLWDALRRRWSARRIVSIAAVWTLLLAGSALAVWLLSPSRVILTDEHWSVFAYAWFLGVAACLVVLRSRRVRLHPLAAAGVATLLLATLVDIPGDVVEADVYRSIERNPAPGFHDGMRWLRETTSADAVLAVPVPPGRAPDDTGYRFAFAERRLLLGAWAFAPDRDSVPCRQRIARGIFTDGDRRALRAATNRYGVRYLVLDRFGHVRATPDAVARLGRRVFSNSDISIYAVRPSPGPELGCGA